jgi:hypothetical protein
MDASFRGYGIIERVEGARKKTALEPERFRNYLTLDK